MHYNAGMQRYNNSVGLILKLQGRLKSEKAIFFDDYEIYK